jgi:hypothetical protein
MNTKCTNFAKTAVMAFCLLVANAARADTLASSSAGTNYSTIDVDRYVGQSFTTGSNSLGYLLESICLTGYNGASGASNAGNGTLYLFSSAYTGLASNLASGSNLVATVTFNSTDSVWDFSSVTLAADTTYYFYIDNASSFDMYFSSSNSYSGGVYYNCNSSDSSFSIPSTSLDLNFVVTGTAVPEPAAVAGFAGLAALGFAAMKRRKA